MTAMKFKKLLPQLIIIAILMAGILYLSFFKYRPSADEENLPASNQQGGEENEPSAPGGSDAPEAPATPEIPEKLEIDETSLKDGIKNDAGNPVFDYSIVLPKATPEDNPAAVKINEYYAGVMKDAKAYADQTAELAKNDSKFPNFFYPYSYTHTFEIAYRGEKYLSIRRIIYSFEGGAHGVETVGLDVFDPSTGEKLTLAALFSVGPEVWKDKLMTLVSEQIKSAGGSPDSGWTVDPDELADVFNENDFCVTADGLVLVFQPYSIAPYAEGIPEFSIPFDAISDIFAEE